MINSNYLYTSHRYIKILKILAEYVWFFSTNIVFSFLAYYITYFHHEGRLYSTSGRSKIFMQHIKDRKSVAMVTRNCEI
jgi:hypothetical protein